MHDEGKNHQPPVAKLIRDDSAEDDDEAEARQAAAGDVPQFLLSESVLAGPVHQDAAANAETHARRKDREEAGPQKSFRVGRNDGTHVRMPG